jgi:hypothetical protein
MRVILDGLIVRRYTWPTPYSTAPDAVDGGRDLYVIMARARRLDLGRAVQLDSIKTQVESALSVRA